MHIREMTIDDYEALLQLLTETPGVTVRDADSYEATARYLAHNPGLSFVAMADDTVVGCVMSGHDGRRGYLQHLAVKPQYRRQGIGDALVNACLNGLALQGIRKTHIFVFKTNTLGNAFWRAQGWRPREEINMYSYINSESENE